MASTRRPNWYQANWQTLQQQVFRIRQLLETSPEDNSPDGIPATISPTSALAQLSSKFHLSPFAQDILLLCVGMEIDPTFASLCAKANGNPQHNFPTLSLAISRLPQASWSVLSPQNPLQHW